MADTHSPTGVTETPVGAATGIDRASLRVDFWLFVVMLALAIVGVGVTQLEESGITNRGPASDFSLLILALSCYLAGVHFNWTFLLLGGVLAIIAVGLGYLDQLSVFALILPVAALAVWIVFKRRPVVGPGGPHRAPVRLAGPAPDDPRPARGATGRPQPLPRPDGRGLPLRSDLRRPG